MNISVEDKKNFIEEKNDKIPIYKQCELLGLCRSSYYYKSDRDDNYNEYLMRLIDEQYTKTPFYGIPRMTVILRSRGHIVNHKRVERLMKKMGIEAIYPKRCLSKVTMRDFKYPYLLKGLSITHPNHVWCSDITYIRMRRGFVYLVAVMDWFSRYVISWELSTTLETDFCIRAIEKGLLSGKPEIFNSDQGSQFTSIDFTSILSNVSVRISMDGRGRAMDNIFVERLWRSVKYEEVYLNDYENVKESRERLTKYFQFYNNERPHQSLGYKTPGYIYFNG